MLQQSQPKQQPIHLTQNNVTTLTGLNIRRFYSVKKDCAICMSDIFSANIIRMNCGDTFHKECIFEAAKTILSDKNQKLKCPSQGCNEKLSSSLLMKFGFNQETLDNYYKFQLEQLMINNQKEISCCLTPGCEYIFRIDPSKSPSMLCELCNRSYCFFCKSEAHKMYTCAEYQATKNQSGQEQAFKKLMETQQCKLCTKCKAWIVKSQGCNHMTCRCGYEFCYRCGRVYRHKDCTCPLFDRT